MTAPGPPLLDPGVADASARRVERAARAFVTLGIALRVARYALNSPLWWNEAFVAANFLRRGYLDLLRPLDYGQVCPILFLWAEKAIADALGFAEWTLRLYPLLCGSASVLVFDRLARLVTPGRARLLAVAIFGVSYHPIRLSAEAKPYASDLLAALLVLWLAAGWLLDRSRTARLWILTGLVPFALAMSHPAAFVVGGAILATAPAVWRQAAWRPRIAWAALCLSTVGSFLILYALYTGAQSAATLGGMRDYWSSAFPDFRSAGSFVGWLLSAHSGRMFAYPGGGEGGASVISLILVLAGVWSFDPRGRTTLGLWLGPFALTFLAAALRRHPYGGHPRIAQHLAPAICLLAGLGAAGVIGMLRPGGRRSRVTALACACLAAVGIVPLIADAARPYRDEVEARSRAFARRFWPALGRGAEVACLRWDLGVARWESADLDAALYLCNQGIASPGRRDGPRWDLVASGRPLRCVLYESDRSERTDLAAWLGAMRRRFDLVGQSTHEIDGPRGPRGRVRVFEFVARVRPSPVAPAGGGIQFEAFRVSGDLEAPGDGRR
jgi:hypothetical protein